jgi:glycyl-tRNA synthetase beta chain
LLVELLIEELPPKSLKRLSDSFNDSIITSLQIQGLVSEGCEARSFASPRRLAVHIRNVASHASDKSLSHKLMPVSVGLDKEGQPTPALRKKLETLLRGLHTDFEPDSMFPSLSQSQLKRAFDGKTEALFFESLVKGVTLEEGLQKALNMALDDLPIPKLMSYQLDDGWTTVHFVRPAHGLVALHGAEIVPVSVLGLAAGRETRGHRFESRVNPIVLKDADSYAEQLRSEGNVVASFAERRAEIARQINAAAGEQDLKPVEDEALLDEVTGLVECPNVLAGEFEREFLQVPNECLILTMRANQKYFPLLDANGKLSNKFLIVSNIHPADASQIICGNERVLRSRLADAKFFFDQDRKKTLASRVEGLREVVYHHKLGTQAERVERIWAIAQAIGLELGGNELVAKAGEAAMLCKADLLTGMVAEFPELQGVMGRYYALHDGLAENVADAIEDHYKPRFAGDVLPRNMVGICIALADKLESLVGMFGIGQMPTGDKDPFALRRHALGLIRILIERELPLALDALLEQASSIFGNRINNPTLLLTEFIYERVRHLFSEAYQDQGSPGSNPGNNIAGARIQLYSPQQVDAVLALRPRRLHDVKKRLDAVQAFAALPEAESLAATNKRVGNILKKAGVSGEKDMDNALLQAPAENALYEALTRIVPRADAAFGAGNYSGSLQILAALKQPVDEFFDHVMVNTEDEALRNNRLALLANLRTAMNRVADISRLAV